MTERPVSPQDKKRLSLERDCRNIYGESDKGSRKTIPRFKRRSVREERRKVDALLGRLDGSDALAAEERLEAVDARLAEARFEGAHPGKVKVPDKPLGLILSARQREGNT